MAHAIDTPPPPQSVAMPKDWPRFFRAYSSVTMIRHPVAPTGCPSPMPEPLTDDDEELLAGIDDGPLGDQLDWHRQLTSLAVAERQELVDLERLAGDAPVIELPLLDVDIHDVPGLVGLAERLV